MENVKENYLIDINGEKIENIFKLDYKEQSVKDNSKFNSWRNRMLQKYGNDAKLFKCSYDKIYFYPSNKKLSSCSSTCPSCNLSICYYCSRLATYDIDNCCLKRRIHYKLFYDGFLFINGESNEFQCFFYLFLIPLCTHFLFIHLIYIDFFYDLKKSNPKDYNKYYFKEKKIFRISIMINKLMAIILTVTYIIYSFYFKIILLFISLFTKFYPIKYYLGIIKKGLKYLY